MKTMRIFTLSMLLIMSYLNLHSQPKDIKDLRIQDIHYLTSEKLEKMDIHKFDKIINLSFELNTKPFNKLSVALETNTTLDSAITTNPDSSLNKHSFTYDRNGFITLKLTQILKEGAWVNEKQYTYEYDSNGNMTIDLYQVWVDGAWVNNRKFTKEYDNNGNWTLYLSQIWVDGVWVNNWQFTYEFNNNGNWTSYLSETWEAGTWLSNRRNTFTYDTNGNRTLTLSQILESSVWVNYSRSTFTYDNNGNLIMFVSEIWEAGAWVNNWQRAYKYDGNGNLTLDLSQIWVDGAWVNSRRNIIEYDSNENRTLQLSEKWESGAWLSTDQYTSEYDSNGNRTLYLSERWESGAWINIQQYTYEYDNFGNMTMGTYIYLENSYTYGGNFYLSDAIGNFYHFIGVKVEIFYNTITDVKDDTKNYVYELQQNYPNPFNPSTTISYTIPKNSRVQLRVYDILGREVASLVNKEQTKGNYKVEFDAANLTSGIYFYRLQSNDFTETKKLILLK